MKFWKIALSSLFAILLFGCANHYQSPQDINTPVSGVTKEQLKNAILASGSQDTAVFGTWKIKEINESTLQASLFNRGYEVVVNIPYSVSSYSIKYVSVSENLKDSKGNVHRNYNRWIKNLDIKIRQNIFLKQ